MSLRRNLRDRTKKTAEKASTASSDSNKKRPATSTDEAGTRSKKKKIDHPSTLFSHAASAKDDTKKVVSRIFLPAHLKEAIKTLRGDSEADSNCIQLTVNILNYLRTGIPPTEPAATITGTSEQVRLFPKVDRSGKVTGFDVQNGSVALSQHNARLQGHCCPQEKMKEELKKAANAIGVPIYGFVVLVSANAKASHDGHVIPFYATPNKGEWAPYQVCFIDGHNISHNEYLAEPVLATLKNGNYRFIDFKSRTERNALIEEIAEEDGIKEDEVNVFQNDCFYFIEGPASVKVLEPHSEKEERRHITPPSHYTG